VPDVPISVPGVGFAHSVYWGNTISRRREPDVPRSMTLTNVAVFERREFTLRHRVRQPTRQARRSSMRGEELTEHSEELAQPD
jgi:hypothetical protein